MECSEATVRAYMGRYAQECVDQAEQRTPDCKDYIRIHAAGPQACRPGTKAYHMSNRLLKKAENSCEMFCEKEGSQRICHGSDGSDESEEGSGESEEESVETK